MTSKRAKSDPAKDDGKNDAKCAAVDSKGRRDNSKTVADSKHCKMHRPETAAADIKTAPAVAAAKPAAAPRPRPVPHYICKYTSRDRHVCGARAVRVEGCARHWNRSGYFECSSCGNMFEHRLVKYIKGRCNTCVRTENLDRFRSTLAAEAAAKLAAAKSAPAEKQ